MVGRAARGGGWIATSPDGIADRVIALGARVVTLDVFDTVLYRLCMPATVVERSCAEMGARAGLDTAEVVAVRRKVVRRLKARAERDGLDREWRLREGLRGTLAGVGLATDTQSVEDAARAELDLERAAVQPAPSIDRAIARIREAGAGVHFVSDTYLSAEDVTRLLAAHGLAALFDGGFTSSGPLLLKSTGRLFGFVMQRLGAEPRDLVHAGNHPKSDLAMASRAGLGAVWLLDGVHVGRMAALAAAGALSDPDSRAAYRHIGRRSAAMVRHARRGDGVMFEIGRSVVAPAAGHLALHVLERHMAHPFEKILFLAREALPVLAAARRLAAALDLDVGGQTLEYAMISRAVTVLPAADPADPLASGSWTIGTKSKVRTAREYLGQLLLPDGIVDEFLPRVDPDLDVEEPSGAEARATIARLGRDPRFLEAAGRERDRQRGLLFAYLASIGVGPGTRRLAIVDVGWAGSTQDNLARLLGAGRGPEIEGFYLGLTARGEPPRPGSQKDGFLVDEWRGGVSGMGILLTAGAIRVCEILLRAHHGTTIGFAEEPGRIAPVLGPSLRDELSGSPESLERLGSLLAGFVEGLEDMARSLSLETVRPLASRIVARAILHRLIAFPSPAEARAILAVDYVQDAGQGRAEPIGEAGIAAGTAWIPGVLAARRLRPLQPGFDVVCLGHEIARNAVRRRS